MSALPPLAAAPHGPAPHAEAALPALHRRAQYVVLATLVMLCSYVFVLQLGSQMLHGRFSTSWLSIPGFILYFLLFRWAVRRSGAPKEEFGLTTRHWRRSLAEALLCSLPIMALTVAAKAMLMAWHPRMHGDALFEWPAHLGAGTPWLLLAEMAAYAVFTPFQEFIVRGCMQGTLADFLHGPRRTLTAIVLTNFIYAALHLYMSVIFSVMVLVPGLAWGWLYARHRTLVGVCVSHALCGIFGFFVVGFDTLILIYG